MPRLLVTPLRFRVQPIGSAMFDFKPSLLGVDRLDDEDGVELGRRILVVDRHDAEADELGAGEELVAGLPVRDRSQEGGLLEEVYAGAPWVDLNRLLREVRDPGTPWSEIARFYFNLASPGTLAAVDPAVWAAALRRRELVDGERIALGFDGSHSRDGTALVACTADGWLSTVEIIERPEKVDEWRVDRSIIHRAVERLFDTYDVAFLFADPWGWRDELDTWADSYPDRVVDFPTNSVRRMAPAIDRFRSALEEGRLTHSGQATLERHALNGRLKKVGRNEDGRGRYTLGKAGPGRLIDALVASILAYEAAAQMANPIPSGCRWWGSRESATDGWAGRPRSAASLGRRLAGLRSQAGLVSSFAGSGAGILR